MLELAGVSAVSKMDGRSLVPLLRGEHPQDWRASILIQYNTDTVFPRVHKMGYRAIRTKRWKYIRYNDLDGMDELYDLMNDPYEMQNIIQRSASKEVLENLRSELTDLLNENS